MSRRIQIAIALAAAAFVPSIVTAQQAQDETPPEKEPSSAAVSAEAGQFLPTTIAPRVDSQRGFVRAFGGYDSARRSALFEARGDVTVWGPIAATVGALYTTKKEFAPTVGVRVQALNQEHHFIDLSIGGYYKPEGFTELEGEIEFVLSVGRRFGRLSTFANLVFGQEPDAGERDGELRLAALYEITTPLQVGLDSRLRFDLGSDEGKEREEGGDFDLVVGPTASYAIGPVAAYAQAGLSVGAPAASPGREIRTRAGAVMLLGVAGSI